MILVATIFSAIFLLLYVLYVNNSSIILFKVHLGVQLKNEAKVVEMCSILDAHNKFIPIHEQADIVTSCGKQGIVEKSKFV